MIDLRDLLVLLYRAHERVTTIVAEYEGWSYPKPSYELVIDRAAPHGTAARWRGPGPWTRERQVTRRFWYENPDRLRVEVVGNQGVVRLGVRDGTRWWRWDQRTGVTTGDLNADSSVEPAFPPLLDPPLFAPARLLAPLQFEPAGAGVRAGRAVVCARGRPRRRPGFRSTLEYDFEFDAEHGTLLRRAIHERGSCIELTEAVKIRYGAEIEPARFAFDPADGAAEQTRPTARTRQPTLHVPRGLATPVPPAGFSSPDTGTRTARRPSYAGPKGARGAASNFA
jgi:hypothetical protein